MNSRYWFVALPDTEASRAIALDVRRSHGEVDEIAHPSGRPWLVGRWSPDRLAVGTSRRGMLAVLGEHDCTSRFLDARAAEATSTCELDELARRVAGSAHLIGSIDGAVRVQGTASGLRRVYHCAVDGVQVAGDNAGVLAALARAPIDPARVATRLMFPRAPWPLGWSAVWRDVEAVWPGHYVLLSPIGSVSVRRWWSPPEPDGSTGAGPVAFRQALEAAVRLRVAAGQDVVSHLSGLDSSSVCSLAAREHARVVALTAAAPDPMDDDVAWARRTVAGLRKLGHELGHEVVPAEECPLVYADMLPADNSFDEPFLYAHTRRRLEDLLRRGAGYGPALHLTGFGGDEVSLTTPATLRTLLSRAPTAGMRQLRATIAANGWSYLSTAGRLLKGRTYPAWLRSTAGTLGHRPIERLPDVGWDCLSVLPGWVTTDAVDAVRAELRDAAEQARALDATRATHSQLAQLHSGAQTVRAFQTIAAGIGVHLAAPFFDDKVIEAALSSSLDQRRDPGRYKPLLVDAMRGIVPETTLSRRTKSETASSAVLGGRRHRDQIVGLAEDSRLAALGLIDADEFRRTCHGPIDVVTAHRRIEPTLCCELWLRSHERTGTCMPLHATSQP